MERKTPRRRKVRSSHEGAAPRRAHAAGGRPGLRAGVGRAGDAALVAISLAPATAAAAQLSRQLGQLARRQAAGSDARQRSLDPHDAGGALRCAGALQDLARTAARAASAAARALAPVQGATSGAAAADSPAVQHLPANAPGAAAGAAQRMAQYVSRAA